MSMNRWMKVACAAVVACSGCTESQVDPEQEILLSGKVLKEDGQPLADTLLRMHRSGNSSCVFSLFGGLDWKSMKTQTDGAFSEELLGADTQAGSLARCFELQIPGTGSGNYGNASFIIQTEKVQLPLLQQWTGKPSVATSADGVSVSYEGLTASQAGNSGTHTLSVSKSSSPIWVSRSVSSPAPLNDDLLEDAADLKAAVSIRREVELNKTKFDLYNKGDDVALPKRTRVPLSRGVSCTYPEAPVTCPLTDGDLASTVTFPQGTLAVVLQLPQPKVLRKAVVRNLGMSFGATTTDLVIEGSTDGTLWVPLANLRGGESIVHPFYEATLSNPTALSQVRLRAAGTSFSADRPFYIERLSELSFFE
ncbi:hypothetical protein NR798_15600 [Archangium gephyra]|uniref:hypothetical protein n=1 Tax=Archangium gephyra TaxID=48 RepID=UPI0035D44755